MELNPSDKFFIEDEDDNLILITSMKIEQNMVKNRFLLLEGTRFYVDYESNSIDEAKEKVEISISFNVEDIVAKD